MLAWFAMASTPSNANPQMLRWARERAGLSAEVVSSAEKIYLDELLMWERGDTTPSLARLRSLATRYKRPLMVFYLPKPPKEFTVVKDYRKLPSSAPAMSPELRYAIRRAQERQAWASEYLSDIGAPNNELVGSLKPNAKVQEAAESFRRTLGITISEQQSCDVPLEGFKLWRDKIEQTGFFVFQASRVAIAEMRGCALPDAIAPVALLNSKDADVAKSFTLLHEVAHLLLGQSAITGGDDGDFDIHPTSTIEKFCNRFAGEVIVPRNDFVRLVPKNWQVNDDEFLRKAARTFCVSRAVVAYRLIECGFAPQSYLAEKWPSLQSRNRPEPEGGPPEYKKALSRNGTAFASLALSAYHGNSIHAGELSSLLDMKLNHLAQLESAIYPNRAQPA